MITIIKNGTRDEIITNGACFRISDINIIITPPVTHILVRYDVDISFCNTTIEVKCSRKSITQKSLNEKMDSDSFHYNRNNIIFFVYDKESIVSDIQSYHKTYNKVFDNKSIDIIIIQPIIL